MHGYDYGYIRYELFMGMVIDILHVHSKIHGYGHGQSII
jgi:hypothetical protein